MEIFLYYIKHYIYGITQKLCTNFPAIHCWADWQNEMFIEEKKYDNNLTEPLPMSLRIFEDACFKKWILMPTNIYKTTAIKISYLLTSQEDRRRRPSIFPCSQTV